MIEWTKPPWRDNTDEDGCWPWVGDQFLAAVAVKDGSKRGWGWEYAVLAWSESCLTCDGEAWSAWGEGDIEWIARIPEPPSQG